MKNKFPIYNWNCFNPLNGNQCKPLLFASNYIIDLGFMFVFKYSPVFV